MSESIRIKKNLTGCSGYSEDLLKSHTGGNVHKLFISLRNVQFRNLVKKKAIQVLAFCTKMFEAQKKEKIISTKKPE